MLPIEEHAIYRAVLEGLQTGVYVLDRAGRILLWNRGAERLTGFMQYEVIGHSCRENILARCNQQGCVSCGGECPFGATLRDGQPRDFRIQLAHKQGHSIQVLMHSAPILDGNGATLATAQSFDQQRFATDSERTQHSLSAYGCLDRATEVPNCGYMRFQLRESIAAFVEYHLPFGIIVIQVDHLDRFRAAYGHAAGDAILRVAAQTIRNGLYAADLLGRWAEDQFLVVLPNCGAQGMRAATERIARLVDCAKLQWWGDAHSVTISIGCALVQEGDSMESLLLRAKPGAGRAAAGDVARPVGALPCRDAAEAFKG
jgi:diguanylate cyclase (GGDEF)-like protein/PAS domain S-box-containing protein